MNDFNFVLWLSIVGPVAVMFWALRQESQEGRKQMLTCEKKIKRYGCYVTCGLGRFCPAWKNPVI